MKNNHYRVLKKFGATIFALGLLSANNCYAQDASVADGVAPKEGVSTAELNALIQNFEINQNGAEVSFAGLIPARCTSGASISYQGAKAGKQIVMVHLGGDCESNAKLIPGEKLVPVSSVFQNIKLQDISGTLTLRHLAAGDPNSRNRIADETLTDDSNNPIKIVSQKDQADLKKQAQIDDLFKDIDSLCKKGDFASLSNEIQGATSLLGDVTDMLDKVQQAQQQQFKDQMAASKSANEAKTIMDNYRDAADSNGWDENALNDAYIAQRFSLLSGMAEDMKSDKDIKAASVEKAIVAWQRELRQMDRDSYRKSLDKFSEAYGNIAVALAGQKNYAAAADYYEKAKEFATSADVKMAFDKQIVNAYVTGYKACLAKDASKAASCDANYAAKAKAAAGDMKDALANGAGDSDDAASAYQDFLGQYAQTFGGGPSITLPGYGSHSAMPGALEQLKQQSIQQAQQQQYIQMQQQQLMMQQRMMGMPTAGVSTGSGLF